MSFLEELSRSATSSVAVWHQFVQAHRPSQDEWYIFVEGGLDLPFYCAAMRGTNFGNARIVHFRCDGKTGVLDARREVRRSHPRCTRVLFFVDKDVDDHLGLALPTAPDLFCTRVYSVENYMVGVDALETIWREHFCLPQDDPALATVRNQYRAMQARFRRILLPIMAWVLLAKRAGLRPNVNNLNIGRIVAVDDCEPSVRAGAYETLLRETSCSFRPNVTTWLAEAKKLAQLDLPTVVRGKFDIWFLARFLQQIVPVLKKRPGCRLRCHIALTEEGLGHAVAGAVHPVRELHQFLRVAANSPTQQDCWHGV
jgi:hypothetical protein